MREAAVVTDRHAPTFEEFVESRGRDLWRSAWLLTGDAQKAEDLVQTALVKCWLRWSVDRQGRVGGGVRTAGAGDDVHGLVAAQVDRRDPDRRPAGRRPGSPTLRSPTSAVTLSWPWRLCRGANARSWCSASSRTSPSARLRTPWGLGRDRQEPDRSGLDEASRLPPTDRGGLMSAEDQLRQKFARLVPEAPDTVVEAGEVEVRGRAVRRRRTAAVSVAAAAAVAAVVVPLSVGGGAEKGPTTNPSPTTIPTVHSVDPWTADPCPANLPSNWGTPSRCLLRSRASGCVTSRTRGHGPTRVRRSMRWSPTFPASWTRSSRCRTPTGVAAWRSNQQGRPRSWS